MLSKFVRWGGVFLVSYMMLGCVSSVKLKPEDVVKQRTEDRWAALIEGKLETAYTFETPEYRELYMFSDFRKKVRGVGIWQKATVDEVTCEVEKCSVIVRVYVNMKFGLAFEKIETDGQITENWIHSSNGQWYHVSDH